MMVRHMQIHIAFISAALVELSILLAMKNLIASLVQRAAASTDTASAGSGTHNGTSSSASAMVSTLIPVVLQAIAFFVVFLILRSRYRRVYRPRTYLPILYEQEKTQALPDGKFNWVSPFKSIPDEFVLNHQSLDGYLYLRFLKMTTIICLVGCIITWPILFPVNATGHGGQKELDLLSFSNINKQGKNRYFAHTFLAWIFFSFIMFVITRETIYFINLRHAYLLAPFNAAKISSRTVLFTQVPAEYLNTEKLQQLFGASFRRCWLATDCKKLEKEVEQRNKYALKLEDAEIKLSQKANKRRLKAEKKNEKSKTSAHNARDEEAATVGSQWLEKKDRPTHRLGKIPLIGKKVDTIEWARSELSTSIPQIEKSQATHLEGEEKLLPSVFVEFTTQQAAEAAFRRMTPKKSPHMNPRAISVAPNEIIWKNLKLKKAEWKGRKFATTTFIVLLIIFWSIPVAVVGAISNINYLTNLVPFLSFINKIPSKILGIVTGLLPSVLLSVLMALVPIICRWMAKLGGAVSLPEVELRTQHWYMAFQVVQVFLITTFSSGAASVVTQIINEPTSATTLLAENLPKASNFYISYFIVQGLGIAAGNILNIGSLAMIVVVGKFLDKSPRKIFKRYITLAGQGWGSLYPRIGNLAIIAISYSIIAPLVLGFATIGFGLIYLATRYNALYVLTNNIDTKGAAYGRALQQLMTGVYISEICLIGLFAINTAPGPIVLMVIFLIFTALYHALMRNALLPLIRYLPDNLDDDNSFEHTDVGSYELKNNKESPSELDAPASRGMGKKAGLLVKFFDPRKYSSRQSVKSLVPAYAPPRYEEVEEEKAYFNPVITALKPRLWIVRDEMGISRKECTDSGEVVDISDEYATFNEKGKVVWDDGGKENLEGMPVWEKRVDY